MPNYLKTMYRKDLKPNTIYPEKLAIHLINNYFPKNANRVVDVGAGTGNLATQFWKNNFEVFCVDDTKLSGKSVIPNVKQIWTDFNKLKFPIRKNFCDVIILKSVIEHMTKPLELLLECKRILSPKGRIIILTPDWVRNKSRFYDDHTHVTPFTKISLKNILLLGDFKNINVDYLIPLPLTWRFSIFSGLARLIGPVVPSAVEWKPLRWSRERQLIGIAEK